MSKASKAHQEGHLLPGEFKKKHGWFGGHIITSVGSIIQHIGDAINLIPLPFVSGLASAAIGEAATAVKVVGDLVNGDIKMAEFDAVKYGSANLGRGAMSLLPIGLSTVDGITGGSKLMGGMLAKHVVGKPVDADEIAVLKTPGTGKPNQLG